MTAEDLGQTRLGEAVLPSQRAHPGQSGVFALYKGVDAFAARVLLADAAERFLSIQSYIWRKDLSGTLMFDAVLRAAERGVRVRLLFDDNSTVGLGETLAALDAHPNIEVRLFNPFPAHQWRALSYVVEFGRLNRRMHNKSFTADDAATIIGGRNIGDRYFDFGDGMMFVDLDVLAVGKVAFDVSKDFDRYWESESSYPLIGLCEPANGDMVQRLFAAAAQVRCDPAAVAYVDALSTQTFVRDLLGRRLAFEWTDVHMVSDDPAKGLDAAAAGQYLGSRLARILVPPIHELTIVSPYFVPGGKGVDCLVAAANRGVRISILTNSLAATDVPAVHAGYARRRKVLLQAGIALFEMKRTPSTVVAKGVAKGIARGDKGPLGSSSSSLHAKTFWVDGAHVVIGSFNFDPRSAHLNTELGFVIESPELTQSLAHSFARITAEQAYQLRLTGEGSLQWVDRADGKELVNNVEPETSFWKRLGVFLLSMLPIEWLL